jgi:hypothetical protein
LSGLSANILFPNSSPFGKIEIRTTIKNLVCKSMGPGGSLWVRVERTQWVCQVYLPWESLGVWVVLSRISTPADKED